MQQQSLDIRVRDLDDAFLADCATVAWRSGNEDVYSACNAERKRRARKLDPDTTPIDVLINQGN